MSPPACKITPPLFNVARLPNTRAFVSLKLMFLTFDTAITLPKSLPELLSVTSAVEPPPVTTVVPPAVMIPVCVRAPPAENVAVPLVPVLTVPSESPLISVRLTFAPAAVPFAELSDTAPVKSLAEVNVIAPPLVVKEQFPVIVVSAVLCVIARLTPVSDISRLFAEIPPFKIN